MTNYNRQGLNYLLNYLWLSQMNLPQNKNLIFRFCCVISVVGVQWQDILVCSIQHYGKTLLDRLTQ